MRKSKKRIKKSSHLSQPKKTLIQLMNDFTIKIDQIKDHSIFLVVCESGIEEIFRRVKHERHISSSRYHSLQDFIHSQQERINYFFPDAHSNDALSANIFRTLLSAKAEKIFSEIDFCEYDSILSIFELKYFFSLYITLNQRLFLNVEDKDDELNKLEFKYLSLENTLRFIIDYKETQSYYDKEDCLEIKAILEKYLTELEKLNQFLENEELVHLGEEIKGIREKLNTLIDLSNTASNSINNSHLLSNTTSIVAASKPAYSMSNYNSVGLFRRSINKIEFTCDLFIIFIKKIKREFFSKIEVEHMEEDQFGEEVDNLMIKVVSAIQQDRFEDLLGDLVAEGLQNYDAILKNIAKVLNKYFLPDELKSYDFQALLISGEIESMIAGAESRCDVNQKMELDRIISSKNRSIPALITNRRTDLQSRNSSPLFHPCLQTNNFHRPLLVIKFVMPLIDSCGNNTLAVLAAIKNNHVESLDVLLREPAQFIQKKLTESLYMQANSFIDLCINALKKNEIEQLFAAAETYHNRMLEIIGTNNKEGMNENLSNQDYQFI